MPSNSLSAYARRCRLPVLVSVAICLSSAVSLGADASSKQPTPLMVGRAKVDVTPETPIRLSGYAARTTESEGVEDRLHARALAVGTSDKDASILVTLDSMALPGEMIDAVSARVKAKVGVPRERFAVSGTHSHATPCLTNAAPNIFGKPIPPDQQERIDRYTRLVADRLVAVAVAAVADMKPGTLGLARGQAKFAANRRTKGGPVDHELPLLAGKGEDGDLRVVLVTYACHATTTGGTFNKVGPDWPGYAADAIERDNSGVVALVNLGCGADANPTPRGELTQAKQYGGDVAAEAKRLLAGDLRPIRSAPTGKLATIDLAYDKLPTAEGWAALAKRPDAVGFNARVQLAREAAGTPIPTSQPYRVQTWTFGDDLAMVFLAGEVVVDYAIRLKAEFDPAKLWVNAYSNDVPCYIPSRRILKEGGYEAESSMIYYGRPGRLAPAVENDVIRAIHDQLPTQYRSAQSLNEFPLPKSVKDAVASFKLSDDLTIEPVAVEPLVTSPVAIDWDAAGRLWVLEMYDYPSGLHEDGTPGGRVKVLTDTDGDGTYDKVEVFIDHLPFPQGIMAWRNSVLVCAAPDILYAEKPAGDGNATRKTLFSGFSPDNQQWEVNGLAWGLDNWVYGASSIANAPIRVGDTGRTVELGGRDFRMNPDTLAFEPAAGRTQFCRVRNDWDDWFGNDNSSPLWHYPLPERYVRRNPHVAAPPPRVAVSAEADPSRVFPASKMLERFNNPESANRVTSGCGPGIYRDTLLGNGYYGNAFFCEPVHNVVSRLVLNAAGATFTGRRAPNNATSEFLASTDNWFRPVQVRTGPDGALWVVDMYRFMIEHPRWITPERLAKLDTRAGANKGRIYRIYPKGAKPRPVPSLAKLPTAELAAKLDNSNGTLRDIVHRELYQRQGAAAVPILNTMATTASDPAVRLQALATLDGLSATGGKAALASESIRSALGSSDARLRRNAVRLAETRLSADSSIADDVLKLVKDPDVGVRYQVALSLGEWDDARASKALGGLAASAPDDVWMRAAVVSSSARRPAEVLSAVSEAVADGHGREELLRQLAATVAAVGDDAAVAAALASVLPSDGKVPKAWQLRTFADVLDAADARGKPLAITGPIASAIDAARGLVADAAAPASVRLAALRLLGRDEAKRSTDVKALAALLSSQTPPAIQSAAVTALAKAKDAAAADALVSAWRSASPSVRPAVLDALLGRPEWVPTLLSAVEAGTVPSADVPAAQRERLLKNSDAAIVARAAKALAVARTGTRAAAVAKAKPALAMKADAAAGAVVFAKACVACHKLNGVGVAVGPNLAALTDRTGPALLTAIVDPNVAVEGRYAAYNVETKDDRTLTGLMVDETAAGFAVLQGGGLREAVSRSAVKKVVAAGTSLMPEGLEEGFKPQELADLIAYVQSNESPETLAATLLDVAVPAAKKDEALVRRPDLAVEAMRTLAGGLKSAAPAGDEEYRRIPAIWRAAIAVGRRNDDDELRRLLAAALPAANQPLRHWQAVAIGGGAINGVSRKGVWPAERFAKLLADDADLSARWQRSIDLSKAMADDPAVKPGTRYDALRMIAMAGWEQAGPTLRAYLAAGAHGELQMGAVSGLADINYPRAADALVAAWPALTARNRELAAEAMTRSPDRIARWEQAQKDGSLK